MNTVGDLEPEPSPEPSSPRVNAVVRYPEYWLLILKKPFLEAHISAPLIEGYDPVEAAQLGGLQVAFPSPLQELQRLL